MSMHGHEKKQPKSKTIEERRMSHLNEGKRRREKERGLRNMLLPFLEKRGTGSVTTPRPDTKHNFRTALSNDFLRVAPKQNCDLDPLPADRQTCHVDLTN